jgi:hypothetical protein
MAQPADSISAADLAAVAAGGLLNEDVLQKIYDISPIETPFLDAIQGGSYDNPYHSWVQDVLAATTAADAQIDGANITPVQSATGARVGNHGQISTGGVNVSYVAAAGDPIGRTAEEAYQTAREINLLQNRLEAAALSNNASVADNGSTTAGESAGLGAWLETHTSHGSGGSAGGFNTSTSIVDAPTVGTSRALTWAMIAGEIESCYLVGAKPTKIFSRPEVTKRLGAYLITSDFFVAPVANIGGESPSDVAMSGYVDTFRTDFGYTMTVHPVINQQLYDSADTNSTADACALFGVDPMHVALRKMWGTRVDELGRTGLSIRKMISTHWSLDALLERACFGIFDLQPTATVAAS